LDQTIEEREEREDREDDESRHTRDSLRVNLGALSLLEVLEVLKDEGLLKESLYTKFASVHCSIDISDFLKKFSEGDLASFNYKVTPFTLLDHRRLAELMSNLKPESYYLGEIISISKEVQNFLVSLYDLSSEKYHKLYKNIDETSKIGWWAELIDTNKTKILEACKRNLQHKKNINVRTQPRSTAEQPRPSSELPRPTAELPRLTAELPRHDEDSRRANMVPKRRYI